MAFETYYWSTSLMSKAVESHPEGEPLRAQIDHKLLCQVATDRDVAGKAEYYHALAHVAREQLAKRWVNTQHADRENKARRVYYLSMEFLIGRAMNNALSALDLREQAATVFTPPGPSLNEVMECEPDAALGNGGLGRLAACFLDSMATLGLPSWGYGVRYEYGMFAQSIVNGQQVEQPEAWVHDRSPWEFPRAGKHYTVHFGGSAEHSGEWAEWHPADAVEAKAFDHVIPGHGTERVSTLRLWKAAAPSQIDLGAFNTGDYQRAAEFKNRFENISWVLYPNDSTAAGRELRLRQEYFFVSASMQDILGRHHDEHGSFDNLADKVAIHLNDTHPAIGVAELMRLLVDEHAMNWNAAWEQCRRIFSYTNHTLMPEALETWKVTLMQRVLPRHMLIIYRINQEFLDEVARLYPGDIDLMRRVSLIDDGNGHEKDKRVRMAHLSIVGSHRINGVSQLHSDLMVQTIFADFRPPLPGTLSQQDQRRHAAALAGAIQSRPVGAARRAPRQGVASRSRPPGRPAQRRRRRRVRQGLCGRKARQQAAPGRLRGPRNGHHAQPGQPLRRAGQTHPRVQAAVAQRLARHHPLQRAAAWRDGRRCATQRHFRRQGRAPRITWPSR
jgi:starch phosphorylase